MERSSNFFQSWFEAQQPVLDSWSNHFAQPKNNTVNPIQQAVDWQQHWLNLLTANTSSFSNSNTAGTYPFWAFYFYPTAYKTPHWQYSAEAVDVWLKGAANLNKAFQAWQPFLKFAEHNAQLIQNFWQPFVAEKKDNQSSGTEVKTATQLVQEMQDKFYKGWNDGLRWMDKAVDHDSLTTKKEDGSFGPDSINPVIFYSWYEQVGKMFKPFTDMLHIQPSKNFEEGAEAIMQVQDKSREYVSNLFEIQWVLLRLGAQAYMDVVQQLNKQAREGKVFLSFEECSRNIFHLMESATASMLEAKEYKLLQDELKKIGDELRASTLKQWETFVNPYPVMKSDIEKVNEHNAQLVAKIESLQKSINAVQEKLMKVMVQATDMQLEKEAKANRRPASKPAVE